MRKNMRIFLMFAVVSGMGLAWAGAEENRQTEALGLSWNILSGSGQFSTPTKKVDVRTSGFMVEMEKRQYLATVPGLYCSLAPSFYLLAGSNSFEVEVAAPSAYTQSWSTTTSVAGSALMAKYGYNLRLGILELDLQNGFGAGYFIERDEWTWTNPASPGASFSGSGNGDSFEPVADLNITARIRMGEVSSLGLTCGGILTTFNSGSYTQTAVTKVGLNYQARF